MQFKVPFLCFWLMCGSLHGLTLPSTVTGWEKLAEPSSTPSVPQDGIVEGVNVLSGSYTDHAVDIVTNGIEPYIWERYYCRNSYRPEIYNDLDSPNLLGWYAGYDCSIWYEYSDCYDFTFRDIAVSERSGSYSHYYRPIGRGEYIPASFKGYMNHASGILSGQTHIRNSYLLQVGKNDYRLHLSDGTERSYTGKGLYGGSIYGSLLSWERKPSGNLVVLHNGGHHTYNSDTSILLNWVRFTERGGGQYWTVSSSDQRSWAYYPGKEISRDGTRLFLLGSIVRPDGTTISYQYNDRYFKGNDFFIGKDLPDGRYVRVSYEANKVCALLAPVGADQTPIAKYRFWYGPNHTMVQDALGNYTRYEFDSDSRIHRVMRYQAGGNYRYEQNVWNSEGSLVAKALLDGGGNVYLARTFDYDGNANVVREKIYGNLTGTHIIPIELDERGIPVDNGAECYVKTYSYSPDRFYLLRGETDGVASTEYVYYPETNLLKAKFIYDTDKIRLRQFRSYDACTALTLLIEDDGSAREQDDLSGCTQRKITTYSNHLSGLGVGQPSVKEEKYYDFESCCEVLLKATHYHYNQHNECIQEDTYDSTRTLIYSISRQFDAMGRCIRETDPLGYVTERSYDGNGNLLKIVGPRPDCLVENTYDYSNRLIRTTQQDGAGSSKTVRYRYDLCGNKVAEMDDAGNETLYTYDALGRVVHITYPQTLDADDHSITPQVTKHYDLGDNVNCWIDERGESVMSWYNIRGQPYVRVTAGAEERFEYDLRGNLVKKIAPDRSYTQFTYDFLDRIVRTAHCSTEGKELAVTTAEYTAFALIRTTDAEGATTSIAYDGAGRQTRLSQGNSCAETTYDPLGYPHIVKNWYAEGKQDYTLTFFVRDFLGRILEERVEDSVGRIYTKKTYVYDPLGNCTQAIEHIDETSTATTFFNYDSFGRLLERRDPLGNITTIRYLEVVADGIGGIGSCTIETDPFGNVKASYFNGRSLLVKETVSSPNQKIIQHKQFRYDGVGNRTLMKCEQKTDQWQEIRFRYTQSGKMTEIIAPGQTTRMSYNTKGQLIHKDTPLGTHAFTYDDLGRVVSHQARAGAKHIDLYYGYDRCGRVTQIEQDGNLTQRSYDSRGNIIHEKQESGHSVAYVYDRQGRRVRMTLPDGSAIAYTYRGPFLHHLERLSTEGESLYSHTYSQRDLTGKVLESHLAESGGILRTTYDLMGRPTTISHTHWNQDVSYDPCGNLATIKTCDPQGTSTCCFAYDALYQLTSENDSLYQYDGAGNPSQATVGPCNQLLSCKAEDYTYDLAGRLVSSKNFTCSYDPLDRMVSYNKTTYRYDGLNRRIATDSTIYLYDGNREIGTINKNGKMSEFRLLGEGQGAERGATVAIELAGRVYTTLSDARGSISCLINSAGKACENYRYTAFGTSTSHSNLNNPWRFCSKRFDSESHWVFFGRRYYAPSLTRFTTPDPLGYSEGLNLYTFVHNNPFHSDLYGYRDREGPLESHNLFDFAHKLFHRAMQCIEWIGKNMIPLPGIRDVVEAVGRWGTGGQLFSLAEYHLSHCQVHPIQGQKVSGATVVYINGVRNHLDESIEAATALSKKLGGIQVMILYNSTQGLLMDSLFDTFILKMFGAISPVESMIIDFVKATLQQSPDEIIHIHAHSQGGFHLKNSARKLSPEERSHIEAVTYGSAALIAHGTFGAVRNYVSKGDFVPLFDLKNYIKALSGNSDHVTFLPRTYYNPIKEHMIGETTYQDAMTGEGKIFQQRYL